MLCYLQSVRIIERQSNKSLPPLLSCTWVGQSGETGTEKTVKKDGKKLLNFKAALARTTQLTKGIFPTSDDELKQWLQQLTPLDWQTGNRMSFFDGENEEANEYKKMLKERLGETNGICNVAENLSDGELTQAYLLYEQIPVKDIDKEHEFVYYTDTKGNEAKLSTITAIGYAELDDNDNEVWATDGQESPFDMAKRNYNNNVAAGAYYFESFNENEETEEKESEKSKEGKKKSIF